MFMLVYSAPKFRYDDRLSSEIKIDFLSEDELCFCRNAALCFANNEHGCTSIAGEPVVPKLLFEVHTMNV